MLRNNQMYIPDTEQTTSKMESIVHHAQTKNSPSTTKKAEDLDRELNGNITY